LNPNCTIDGDDNTQYDAGMNYHGGPPLGQWLLLDLGSQKSTDGLRVTQRWNNDPCNEVYTFQLQSSDDGQTFTPVFDLNFTTDPISGHLTSGSASASFANTTPHRWWKLLATKAASYNGGCGMVVGTFSLFGAGLNGPGPLERLGSGGGCLECQGNQSTHGPFPVNSATGNFWHTFADISLPGRGVPLMLRRTYNSLAASIPGRFGPGWSDSYDVSLSFDASGNATAKMEDGSQIPFPLVAGAFVPPSRVLAGLVKNGDGTYTLTLVSQTKYKFSSAGQPLQEVDRNGYATTYSYPAGQEVITDPAGRTLILTLTAGQVTGASDSTGRSVAYQYDGSGNLQKVTDVNLGITQFTYYADHTMHTMTDPNGGVVTNVFDNSKRVTSQSDPMQRITTFDYSIPSQTKITDPKGNVTTELYQSNILMARTQAFGTPLAATWTYGHDANTLATTSISDPNGHVSSSTVDARGNVLSSKDGLGRQAIMSYDSLNDLLSTKDPLGVTTTNTYDSVGNMQSTSRPLAGTSQIATVTYQHTDAAHPGDVTGMIDQDGKLWQYAYDQFGNKTQVVDPLGDKTTYTYNADGWIQTKVSPNGYAIGPTSSYMTSYDYTDQRTGAGHTNGFGDVGVITDQLGRKTTVTYDANRNTTFVKDANQHTTQSVYDLDNELTEVDRADGSKVKTQYDPDGNVQQQLDGLGKATTYGFDLLNHPNSSQDPLLRTTTYVYDAVGNLKTVTDPQSQTTTYAYDAADELTSMSYSATPSSNVGPILYDADGQRQAMTDGTGTTTYTVDSLHRLTQQSNGAHSTVAYGHDLRGHVTSITYPGQTKPLVRTYDDAGRLRTVTDWLGTTGNTTTYNYDADSNLMSQVYPNGTTATFTPDAADQTNSIVDAKGSTQFLNLSYTRDSLGQVKSENATSYGYDSINRLTTSAASSYGYDAGDNLTQLTNGSTQKYDVANEVSAAQAPISLLGTTSGGDGGTSSTVTLTLPLGLKANDQILVSTTGTSKTAVATPAGYTLVGTVTSGGTTPDQTVVFRKTAIGTETTVTLSYGPGKKTAKSVVAAVYRGVDPSTPIDAQSSASTTGGTSVTAPSVNASLPTEKLVLFEGASGNASAANWNPPVGMTDEVHKSDIAGTAAALSDQTLTATGATGTRTATFGLSANLSTWMVALKPAVTNFSYDQRGNRTGMTPAGGPTTTLTYDQANRLTGYGGSATYAYNGDGLRMTKTVSGTAEAFTYDTAEGMPLIIQDGTTSYVTGAGGLPLEQISAGVATYYHQDQLGSTRALTNQAGAVMGTATYDAYGNAATSTGTTSPFQYAGQYRDTESGLYYLRARYYDPGTGQFISRDPMVTTTRQPYAYVADNPLNRTDPSGQIFGLEILLSPLAKQIPDIYINHPKEVAKVTSTLAAGLSVAAGVAVATKIPLAVTVGAVLEGGAAFYGAVSAVEDARAGNLGGALLDTVGTLLYPFGFLFNGARLGELGARLARVGIDEFGGALGLFGLSDQSGTSSPPCGLPNTSR
jgi:RHS repeat-associated protein